MFDLLFRSISTKNFCHNYMSIPNVESFIFKVSFVKNVFNELINKIRSHILTPKLVLIELVQFSM